LFYIHQSFKIIKMKKFFFVMVLVIAASAAHAQVRLNAYGNYVFDDQVDNAYSYGSEGFFEGKVKGGFLWGVGLEYRLHEAYGIELLYNRLDTHAPVNYWDYDAIGNNVKNANIDLSVNYIMLAGMRSMRTHSKAEPYGGLMLGMAIIDSKNPETNNSNSATKFAWGARLGTNIWASDRVGIKLQAQILSVPQGAGGSLYFGTGGAGAGVSTYSTVLQFALGGGLVFNLGDQHPSNTTPTTP
jgi:hypothetical protein